jgi:hypothetical protein
LKKFFLLFLISRVVIALFLPPGKIHIYKISNYQGDGMLVEGDTEKEKVEEEEELKRKEIDALKARYAVFVTQGRRVLTQGVYPGMMSIRRLCQELSLQIDPRNEEKTKKIDIYAYGAFKEFFLFFFFLK